MKIGILAEKTLSEHSIAALDPVLRNDQHTIALALIDQRPPKTITQKFRRNIRRGRGGYILVMAAQKYLSRKKRLSQNSELFFRNHHIPTFPVTEPYSEETLRLLKSSNLDILVLLGGFGIIKEPLLNLAPLGVISYHHGDMRKYRGITPAFWELYHGEKEMGVTIQRLAKGIDCGWPIVEKKISIRPDDGLTSLRDRAYKEGEDMLAIALRLLSAGNFESAGIEEFGKVYTLPNLRQWLLLNIKIFFRKLSYRLGLKD